MNIKRSFDGLFGTLMKEHLSKWFKCSSYSCILISLKQTRSLWLSTLYKPLQCKWHTDGFLVKQYYIYSLMHRTNCFWRNFKPLLVIDQLHVQNWTHPWSLYIVFDDFIDQQIKMTYSTWKGLVSNELALTHT